MCNEINIWQANIRFTLQWEVTARRTISSVKRMRSELTLLCNYWRSIPVGFHYFWTRLTPINFLLNFKLKSETDSYKAFKIS